MTQLLARYPVLTDSRVLTLVAAGALAVVSLVVSGDPAAAESVIHHRP
jgi:hypothetical protein